VSTLVPLVAILCTLVVLPGMTMYFADRWRQRKHEREAAAPAVAELLALAHKLESRVDALERMLDAEAPNWRKDA
jgi:phage shock protein B